VECIVELSIDQREMALNEFMHNLSMILRLYQKKITDEIILDSTPPQLLLTTFPDSGLTNETEFQFDGTSSTDNCTEFQNLMIRSTGRITEYMITPWNALQVFSHKFDTGGGDKQ